MILAQLFLMVSMAGELIQVQHDGEWVRAYLSGRWLGDTPRPVVEVGHQVEVPASSVLLAHAPDRTCLLAKGEYHPWADQVASYASVRSVVEYAAKKRTRLHFEDGTRLELARGASIFLVDSDLDGMCTYLHEEWEFSAPCEEINQRFRVVFSDEEPFYHQYMHVPCAQGKPWAWIQVNDELFEVPGIREGTIEGDVKAVRE